MALADILDRIAADAEAEARAIIARAEEEAAALRREAQKLASERSARILAESEAQARGSAEAMSAAARLQARDASLAAKQALIGEALDAIAEGIVGLPPERYARFVARRIVAVARGDEQVLVAEADRERLAGLADAVAQAAREAGRDGIALRFSDEPAPVAHGVVLRGERDSVDLSVEGLVSAERDRLVSKLAAMLFPDEEKEG